MKLHKVHWPLCYKSRIIITTTLEKSFNPYSRWIIGCHFCKYSHTYYVSFKIDTIISPWKHKSLNWSPDFYCQATISGNSNIFCFGCPHFLSKLRWPSITFSSRHYPWITYFNVLIINFKFIILSTCSYILHSIWNFSCA